MFALPLRQRKRSLTNALSRWWSDRAGRRRTLGELSELKCLSNDQIELIARDLGVSVAEIHKLISSSDGAANLLSHRMAALDLDPGEVARIESQSFHTLFKNCALCEHYRRCELDLKRDSNDPVWQRYCPNAATLMALNALPWECRREW